MSLESTTPNIDSGAISFTVKQVIWKLRPKIIKNCAQKQSCSRMTIGVFM